MDALAEEAKGSRRAHQESGVPASRSSQAYTGISIFSLGLLCVNDTFPVFINHSLIN